MKEMFCARPLFATMTTRVCFWGVLSLLVLVQLSCALNSEPAKGTGEEDVGNVSYHQPGIEDEIGQMNTFNASLDPLSINATEVPPPPRILFSDAPVNLSYQSKDDFNPKGMEHLYLITNTFLQVVHRDEEMPPELMTLVEREVDQTTLDEVQALRVAKDLEENWDAFLFHYIGLTCLVVIGVLLAVLVPISGLIFCCCRCAGKCGGDYPCYDKKRDPCKRALLGALLATLLVILLLGLVCCFVTNARMQEGIEKLPDELETAIADTKLYLNNTRKEVKTLTENNFRELQKVLFNKLDKSGILINGELARVSKAIAISNLTDIASSLALIKKDLYIIRNVTVALQEETSYLQSGLNDVANRLKDLRSGCHLIPECTTLIDNYADKLEIRNNFYEFLESDIMPQLPDVQDKLNEVNRLIENDIEIEVKRGNRAFDSIARDIQSKVQNSIPEIKQQIRNAGQELRKKSRSFSKVIGQIDTDLGSQIIDTSRHYINEYSMYRYWYFFLISSLLLLIILCFTMGLMFGCCGRRPDEATSCHKNTGASWLMWGVGLTFLFAAVIMLTTTSLFFVGSIFELLVCDPLRDPSDSEVFTLAGSLSNLDQFFAQGDAPELPEVIRKCHNNESMFVVLDMHSLDVMIDNFSNYRDLFNLNEKIDEMNNHIGQSIDTNVQILSKEAKEQLMQLANTSIANKDAWYNYTNKLQEKVLPIDLLDLAAQLNETADNLPPNMGLISVKLKNDAIFLEGLGRWLSSIKANVRVLTETTANLSEHLKFNNSSLKVAIKDLIDQAEFAQEYLQVNGSKEVVELVNRFSEDFMDDVDAYVDHVKTNMLEDVGKCGPMSCVYNSTTSAFCKDILYPFNGFWASVGWCFLFFLPCLILAVQLASLYRKTEPYCGPLTECEYLYDAYDERNSRTYLNHESMYDAFAERDNIPLTSGNDKKQCRRSRECENARIASSYSTEPYATQHCSPPRMEYPPNTDWAEYPPSGGPPRYTSQPSLSPEYERPPPYYYPGPGAQYYGGPPPGASSGGHQVHPPPGSGGPTTWNTSNRSYSSGGWKISTAYSRENFDA